MSRQEAEESTQGRFAKTRSRSVLGSMNDFAFQLEFVFRSREAPTLAALSPTSARIARSVQHGPDLVGHSGGSGAE